MAWNVSYLGVRWSVLNSSNPHLDFLQAINDRYYTFVTWRHREFRIAESQFQYEQAVQQAQEIGGNIHDISLPITDILDVYSENLDDYVGDDALFWWKQRQDDVDNILQGIHGRYGFGAINNPSASKYIKTHDLDGNLIDYHNQRLLPDNSIQFNDAPWGGVSPEFEFQTWETALAPNYLRRKRRRTINNLAPPGDPLHQPGEIGQIAIYYSHRLYTYEADPETVQTFPSDGLEHYNNRKFRYTSNGWEVIPEDEEPEFIEADIIELEGTIKAHDIHGDWLLEDINFAINRLYKIVGYESSVDTGTYKWHWNGTQYFADYHIGEIWSSPVSFQNARNILESLWGTNFNVGNGSSGITTLVIEETNFDDQSRTEDELFPNSLQPAVSVTYSDSNSGSSNLSVIRTKAHQYAEAIPVRNNERAIVYFYYYSSLSSTNRYYYIQPDSAPTYFTEYDQPGRFQNTLIFGSPDLMPFEVPNTRGTSQATVYVYAEGWHTYGDPPKQRWLTQYDVKQADKGNEGGNYAKCKSEYVGSLNFPEPFLDPTQAYERGWGFTSIGWESGSKGYSCNGRSLADIKNYRQE